MLLVEQLIVPSAESEREREADDLGPSWPDDLAVVHRGSYPEAPQYESCGRLRTRHSYVPEALVDVLEHDGALRLVDRRACRHAGRPSSSVSSMASAHLRAGLCASAAS